MSGQRLQNDPKMGPGGAQGSKNESQNSKIAEKCSQKYFFEGLSFDTNFGLQTKMKKGPPRGDKEFQAANTSPRRGGGVSPLLEGLTPSARAGNVP